MCFQFISTHTYQSCQFILIFNKMALIFPGVFIVFTFKVSSFSKLGCLDFIANDEWLSSPNHSPLDCQVWGQCWSLITSWNKSQKQFPSLKCTSVDLVCLTGESHWHRCDCRHMCQPAVDILNIWCDNDDGHYTISLYLIKYNLMWLVFEEKFMNIVTNWIEW